MLSSWPGSSTRIWCHSPRHDQGLARPDLSHPLAAFELQADPDATGEQVEQLVGVGVHLAAMRRRSPETGGLDRVAHDASGAARASRPRTRRSPSRAPAPPSGRTARTTLHRYVTRHPHCILLSSPLPSTCFPRPRPGSPAVSPYGNLLDHPLRSRPDPAANQHGRNGKQTGMEQPDGAVIAASLETPATFGVIFDRHGSTLLRFMARRVDPAEAEGLLGEVFRIAFERRSTFEQDRESARPWLYGIAANVVAKYHRSLTRRLRASVRVAALRPVEADPAERAVAAADAGTRWARVIEAIGDPARDRPPGALALRLGGTELRGDRHGSRHPCRHRAISPQPGPGPVGGTTSGRGTPRRCAPHPV